MKQKTIWSHHLPSLRAVDSEKFKIQNPDPAVSGM